MIDPQRQAKVHQLYALLESMAQEFIGALPIPSQIGPVNSKNPLLPSTVQVRLASIEEALRMGYQLTTEILDEKVP